LEVNQGILDFAKGDEQGLAIAGEHFLKLAACCREPGLVGTVVEKRHQRPSPERECAAFPIQEIRGFE
jgi:hypothetical protein